MNIFVGCLILNKVTNDASRLAASKTKNISSLTDYFRKYKLTLLKINRLADVVISRAGTNSNLNRYSDGVKVRWKSIYLC
jgi:hypothetical protein